MILVTGGTGLVGAHLLHQLSLGDESIRSIHRKQSDLMAVKHVFSYFTDDYENQFNKIEWIEADLLDVYLLEQAFIGVKKVYHAAALVSFNPKDYQAMRTINIEGTANIVNLCISNKIEKLCFVSSIAAVGKSINGDYITEDKTWTVENHNYGYAISKYGAEMEVWRGSQEGVPVVIVNPGIIVGAGFWKQGPGAIFNKIYEGLKFYAEGVTGYVGVEDVVKIMVQLMNSNIQSERYILVAENSSFKNFFNQIASHFNKKPPHIKVSKLMSEIGWRLDKLKTFLTNKPPILTKHSAKSIHNNYLFSSKKIEKDLKFKFEELPETIKKVCELYNKDQVTIYNSNR